MRFVNHQQVSLGRIHPKRSYHGYVLGNCLDHFNMTTPSVAWTEQGRHYAPDSVPIRRPKHVDYLFNASRV